MTQTEIICLYFLGSVLCLWLQIYYERKYESGMNFGRFIGAVALSLVSWVGLLAYVVYVASDFITDHGSDMIFTDYDTVNKKRAEQREKKKSWDR